MSEPLDVANCALSRPPSAITTFSNLILSMNSEQILARPSSVTALAVHIPLKSRSPSVGIDTLPTEILLSIFDFVFEICVDWHQTSTVGPKHAVVWVEDDPLAASLFPYSLASVCLRWFHIISGVAVYWTRHVITIGSHATSPIAIQSMLQCVGNLPLQLVITRHSGVSEETDRDEHTRIRAVLDHFQPRIHQVWSLTFNPRHSSSLSALWRGQRDVRHATVPISASGHSDPGSVAGYPRLPAGNRNGYDTLHQARLLEEVAFDRRHFFSDVLVSRSQRNLWFCNITCMTIRGHMTSHQIRTSLRQFITTIQTCWLLQKLTVEDVAFVNDVHPSQRFRLEVPVVCLRGVTNEGAIGSITSHVLGVRMKEAITIADCLFDGFGKRSSLRTRISSLNLTLEGMNSSATAIQQLVCCWDGENLSLINCLGVSASFLQGIPIEETPPNLRRLRIVGCKNASARGLVSFVRSRELQSAIDAVVSDDRDESCVPLTELRVHGKGPSISTEQAEWLAKHVDTFTWDTTADDGIRYTWDASAGELIVLPAHN